MAEKEAYCKLDENIGKCSLSELHTHLMGMGSADFWVSRIIETYIPRSISRTGNSRNAHDVFYPLKVLIEASDITIMGCGEGDEKALDWSWCMKKTAFEARMFDGLNSTMKECFEFSKKSKDDGDVYYGIYNSKLMELLHQDDGHHHGKGPLRAMIRNWFEFLDGSGSSPCHTDVIDSCKYYLEQLYIID